MTSDSMGTLTVLGCGGSTGVPVIGNDWGSCDPSEPRNLRTRASIAVQKGAQTIVVDTGADFRSQINRENIKTVSAVFYTHSHSDHINGIDDLRPFRNRTKTPVPVYAMPDVIEYLETRFDYMFRDGLPYYPRALEPHVWTPDAVGSEQDCNGISYRIFRQDHEGMLTLGFRFGDVAYSTDMVNLDDAAIEVLRGVKIWIADGNNLFVDMLGPHANLKRLQELNEKIGAELVYATHLKNNLDYRTMLRDLPQGFRPAFDGLKMTLDGQVLNDDAGQ